MNQKILKLRSVGLKSSLNESPALHGKSTLLNKSPRSTLLNKSPAHAHALVNQSSCNEPPESLNKSPNHAPALPNESSCRNHALVHKYHLLRLQHDSKQLQHIKKKMDKKIYQSTRIGHQLLGKALSILPKASHDALQDANPLRCAAFAADIGIPCGYKKVAQVRPSRRTYKRVIEDQETVNYSKSITMLNKNPNTYISAEKSNSEKGGSKKATLPKIFTFTDIVTHTIITFLLYCNGDGDDSEDVSKAIRHRIKKLQSMMSVPLILRGQSTDSGGGGTLEYLAKHLKSDNSLTFAEGYIVASCRLHNLQTALRNAVIDVLGEGGKVAGTKKMSSKRMQ